jgi:hypothetical protein
MAKTLDTLTIIIFIIGLFILLMANLAMVKKIIGVFVK